MGGGPILFDVYKNTIFTCFFIFLIALKLIKNLCFDVRDLEKTISHDIFIQIGNGIIIFVWISTHFKQF